MPYYSVSASQSSSNPQITDNVRIKLSRIVSQHEKLKIAFFHLNSQIRAGLLEAEDVFASLAIPLMTLVGLKTVEMAEEGRFNTVIMDENDKTTHPHSEDLSGNGMKSGNELRKLVMRSTIVDEIYAIRKLEEEKIMIRAVKAGKELMQKQKLQLMQLATLLKQIEVQVNSSQDDILETLADHRATIQKLFQQSITYVSAVHQSCQTNGMSVITLKLLKCTFEHVGSALCSVESGVEDLMDKLADKMCYPMAKYVNDLKAEIVAGTCPSLIALLEDTAAEMRLRRLEVEDARKKVRAAEKSRLDILYKLKESEERLKKMKEQQDLLMEVDPLRHHIEKPVGMKEDQLKDGKLLWEVLRKKRKLQIPDSPLIPKQLLGIRTDHRNQKSARMRPSISCKPSSKSNLAMLSPQTPEMDLWIPLGSSPSAATQQVLSCKGIKP